LPARKGWQFAAAPIASVAGALALLALTGCTTQPPSIPSAQPPQRPLITKSAVRSGSTFVSATLLSQQSDDDLNPGMLWVDQGRDLFARDCAGCHGSAKAMASTLPRLHEDGSVITLEAAINRCQVERVKAAPYPVESQPLLALATWIAFSSRGQAQPVPANVTQSAAWQRAHNEYTRVQGKLDFSCRSCHDRLYGKRVRNQAISQGYGVGYPAYRVDWQTLGSLNRRLRACFFGMETVVPAVSDPILADLELYLVWRAQGLPIEAPAVRR